MAKRPKKRIQEGVNIQCGPLRVYVARNTDGACDTHVVYDKHHVGIGRLTPVDEDVLVDLQNEVTEKQAVISFGEGTDFDTLRGVLRGLSGRSRHVMEDRVGWGVTLTLRDGRSYDGELRGVIGADVKLLPFGSDDPEEEQRFDIESVEKVVIL